jgi:O-antigen ligase
MMVMALALSPYLGSFMNRLGRWGLGTLLAIGLLTPFSRGPWVGAVVVLVLLMVATPVPRRSLIRMLAVVGFAIVCISFTPLADKIIDLMPFVGTVDSYNVDYRARLFDAAWIVIQMNPWFGSTTYMSTPEMLSMIQGEGIIDLVNVYVNVALDHGIVGLSLFSGAFFVAIAGVLKRKKQLDVSAEEQLLGACLFAALGGLLVIIATISNFTNASLLFSLITGLAISYALMPSPGTKTEYHRRR